MVCDGFGKYDRIKKESEDCISNIILIDSCLNQTIKNHLKGISYISSKVKYDSPS